MNEKAWKIIQAVIIILAFLYVIISVTIILFGGRDQESNREYTELLSKFEGIEQVIAGYDQSVREGIESIQGEIGRAIQSTEQTRTAIERSTETNRELITGNQELTEWIRRVEDGLRSVGERTGEFTRGIEGIEAEAERIKQAVESVQMDSNR